jgi:sugar lactone lactonase YvrE
MAKLGNVRCIAPIGDRCGEAATWCEEDNVLYWTDVNRFLIHALDARTNAVRSWFFDEPVVALSLTDAKDELLVALGSRLILWNKKSDARRDHGFRCAGWPEVRLNDGRAAPGGEFWIGSMANNVGKHGQANDAVAGRGELYRVSHGAAPKLFKDRLGISNTVCWSPEGRLFYFGDTMKNTIWAYDYDRSAMTISRERPFFTGFARGHPDGSAVDSEGYLWNCRFGGSCIVRAAPDGTVDQVIEMPVRNVTTCAFGGSDLRTLYITTASILTDQSDRLAGSLFALDVDVAGAAAFRAKV